MGPTGRSSSMAGSSRGATATLEADLDKPGTYTMYCPLDGHRAKGMSGSITGGGSTPPPGPEPTGTTPPTGTSTTPTETQTTTQTQTQTQTQTETETETKTVTTP